MLKVTLRQLGAGIALAGVVLAPVAPVTDVAEASSILAEDVAMRAEFGFPTDERTLQSLATGALADRSFGAPLTAGEAADLESRFRLRAQADPVVAFVLDASDRFGGLYFQNGQGRLELIVLTTASSSDEDLSAIERLAPEGLDVATRVVKHTWGELLAAQATLDEFLIEGRLAVAYPDVIANGLVAEIEEGTTGLPGLPDLGVPVRIEERGGMKPTACSSQTACTPYRGGIKIETPTQFCTWGYYADSIAGGSARYLVTAGHCGLIGNYVRHNGVTVTSSSGVVASTFENGANTDALTAHVGGSSNAVSPFNRIYRDGSQPSYAITSTRATSSQAVGDPMCFVGYVSHLRCGTIEAVNLSSIVERGQDGATIVARRLIRVTRTTSSGDSGGPVHAGPVALGIVTGAASSTSKMLYGPIRDVEGDLGIAVCITSGC